MEAEATLKIEATGYIPGIIGRIAELHGTYYDTYWQMGVQFEAKVAAGLADSYAASTPPATDCGSPGKRRKSSAR